MQYKTILKVTPVFSYIIVSLNICNLKRLSSRKRATKTPHLPNILKQRQLILTFPKVVYL
ncbi:hypothetical protein GCM10023149_37980 [Mucilaginibacter gynuensis]|uniref:Uncharacterized protein n=1 Tax=Mucilaginibacter gynuensis TaxID=1302236 RepID=A0ABP8GZ10_9SPHI